MKRTAVRRLIRNYEEGGSAYVYKMFAELSENVKAKFNLTKKNAEKMEQLAEYAARIKMLYGKKRKKKNDWGTFELSF